MPEPITSAELRELLAQAAPLPWHLRYIGNRSVLGNSVCSGELDSSLRPGDSREVAFVSDALGTPYSYSGTLIVAAVNNLPGLLDTIDTLTADLASLRERAERAAEDERAEDWNGWRPERKRERKRRLAAPPSGDGERT